MTTTSPSLIAAASLSLLTGFLAVRSLRRFYDASIELGSHEKYRVPSPPVGNLAILVTGAGGAGSLGRTTCVRIALANAGWTVFATCMPEEYPGFVESVRHLTNLRVVAMDLRDDQHIERLVKTVEESGTHLYALVNNAVMQTSQPMEHLDVEKVLIPMLAVNVAATLKLTQRCLTRLFAKTNELHPETLPRIVFISSGAANVATALHGAYSICKSGVETAADTLRREFQATRTNVAIAVIEPGMIRTPTAASWSSLTARGWPSSASPKYDALREECEALHEHLVKTGLSPEACARSFIHAACTSAPPAIRYRPGSVATAILQLLPAGFADAAVGFSRRHVDMI